MACSFSPSSGQQFSQICAEIAILRTTWTGVEPKWSSSVAFGYPFEPRVCGLRLQNPPQNWTAEGFLFTLKRAAGEANYCENHFPEEQMDRG